MYTQMPIGIDDFRTVREGYYFVDKTDVIKKLVDHHGQVMLFTRPRRFGKTLTMSMLDYFFDLNKKEIGQKLFAGLAISHMDDRYRMEQGAYPVIFLSLKDFHNTTWSSMYRSFRLLMQRVFARYMYLLDGNQLLPFEKDTFNRVITLQAEPEEYEASLQTLSGFLYKYHGIRPLILIDEYDAPLYIAYQYGYYEDAIPFWKGWFNGALKTNPFLNFAVLTGVQRIAKESIFSGLNNLDVLSVLDEPYRDAFGFTRENVEKMLADLGCQASLSKIQKWYDGYSFGGCEIYNPWSVIQYIDKGCKAKPYWVNTSENGILKELLAHATTFRIQELEGLLQGKSVTVTLNDNVTYRNLWQDDSSLYTMLLTTGYLTAGKAVGSTYNRYALRIPNEEIREVYSQEILNTLAEGVGQNDFDGMFEALATGNVSLFEKRLQTILTHFVSTYDTANRESFYHGFMLGMTALFMNTQYIVSSNRESGYGRFDVALFPKTSHKAGVVMEFKVAESVAQLSEKAAEGLQQIQEKQYLGEFESRHISHVWKYGIAFCGKQVRVLSEISSNCV